MNKSVVRPLLPVKGPIQKVLLSHGYTGVLMWNSKTDRVQCHVCGRWFHHLGSHLKIHEIVADEYRESYGLTFNYPLCGKSISILRSEDVTPQFLAEGTRMRRRLTGTDRLKKNRKPRHVGTATESQKNKYGLCDMQIRARYSAVKEKVGRSSSSPELRKLDRALLEAITRRHGTLNDFRELIGEPRRTVVDSNRTRRKG